MFGFLINLLGKAETPPPRPTAAPVQVRQPVAPPPLSVPSHLLPGHRIGRLKGQHERVLISLKSITDLFAPELKSLIANPPAPTVTIAISVDSIMERLYTGRAQASIAELRKMSPVGVFSADTSRDAQLVELPLQDVLRRLDPSLFKRTLQTRLNLEEEMPRIFEKEDSPAPSPEPPVEPSAPEILPTPPLQQEITQTIPEPEPEPEPSAVALAQNTTQNLSVPLEKLAIHWLQGIRAELAGLPSDATLEIPLDELSAALRLGKVTFPWATLRGWVRPSLEGGSPALGDLSVELPLPVITPLFLNSRGTSHLPSKRQRVAVEEAPLSPFSRSSVSDAPLKLQTAPLPESKALPHPESGNLPAEVVALACALPGVAGAVITLSEGLLVAAQLPPELNRNTVAAFLPQVFSRLEQTTRSMGIGPLQNVLFTANDRPWQIWKSGDVFFAAMGFPRALLPGAQLQLLAHRLSPQSDL